MNKKITKRSSSIVIVALCLTASAFAVDAQQPAAKEQAAQPKAADLAWQVGPTTVQVGTKATLPLAAQHGTLPEGDSAKFLKMNGNPPDPGTTVVAGRNWWGILQFEGSGYIKDDEKIDPDAMLEQIKSNDAPSNEQRRQQGLPDLFTDGWIVQPHYDTATKRLEWGLRLHSSDSPESIVNYTVRLLGRTGYERAVLVSSPKTLDVDMADFKEVLAGFTFVPGERYDEFRPGDHVAEFGLGALVVGGAAAVAAKSGFWKVLAAGAAAFWKVIAAFVVAAFASFRKIFNRKDGTK